MELSKPAIILIAIFIWIFTHAIREIVWTFRLFKAWSEARDWVAQVRRDCQQKDVQAKIDRTAALARFQKLTILEAPKRD